MISPTPSYPGLRKRTWHFAWSGQTETSWCCLKCQAVVPHPEQGCEHCAKGKEEKKASLDRFLAGEVVADGLGDRPIKYVRAYCEKVQPTVEQLTQFLEHEEYSAATVKAQVMRAIRHGLVKQEGSAPCKSPTTESQSGNGESSPAKPSTSQPGCPGPGRATRPIADAKPKRSSQRGSKTSGKNGQSTRGGKRSGKRVGK